MDLAEMLERHPWPSPFAGDKRLEWLWTFDVPLTPAQLWPHIADSSRLNRALGVAEMKFVERDGKLYGSSRPGGVQHAWVEVPWRWVAGQWIESLRVYDRGFSRAVYGAFHFEPHDGGTRLNVYFGAVPRNLFGGLALRYGFPTLEKDYQRVLPQIVAAVKDGRPPQEAPPPLEERAAQRLRAITQQLKQEALDAACVDRLVGWVETGDEQDLYRIQVRERARAWNLDEDALLKVALHATRAGLLELSWDVMCPHCRGVTDENAKLGELPKAGDCKVCGIDFGTDVKEAVEITFHVHPSIRDIPKRWFCSAEPATKDHIQVQLEVAPGQSVEVATSLPQGRYRLRIGGEKRYGYLDVGSGATAAEWRATSVPALTAAVSPTLELTNDTGEIRTFIVERPQWNDLALRPGHLLSFQDFRDLYAEEYLASDVQLGIGEQTILFTDIVGSTAMYAKRGDPAAFDEVRRHFADVFGIIGQHRGAVVKTIGDAAMGAFRDPVDAVRAAAAIQRAFPPERADTMARLRISLNTGPCIAVRLNTDIDYFGHTVNIAAKLQALAEAWQVAMSEATWRAPGVAGYLSEVGAVLEDCVYHGKQIDSIRGKRWTLFQAPWA